jgi:citrate lyase subunit beta / citryl-CoA lyase
MSAQARTRRSWLFVPAHKPDWYAKAIASGADAIIFDLEDSVPEAHKAVARASLRDFLSRAEPTSGPDFFVRINGPDGEDGDLDLAAVSGPSLRGVVLPKVVSAREVARVGGLLDFLERTKPHSSRPWEIVITFETAQAVAAAMDIVRASPRMSGVLGATADGADINRALGYTFTDEGLETLYLRSRILLAARQREDAQPICGLWQRVADLDGLARFLRDNRVLGYRGAFLIHPTHVSVANEVFGLSESERQELESLVAAYRSGVRNGQGAVMFNGRHIDLAHCVRARDRLAQFGITLQEDDASEPRKGV